MATQGEQHLSRGQLQETLKRALLQYSAAYSMTRLLDGRLDYTTLVLRVDATTRLQIDGKIWDRREKELEAQRKIYLHSLRVAGRDVWQCLMLLYDQLLVDTF